MLVASGAESVTDIDIYIYTYTSSDSIPALQDYLPRAKVLGNNISRATAIKKRLKCSCTSCSGWCPDQLNGCRLCTSGAVVCQ